MTSSASQRFLLHATDTYKLSSLLFRNVLLTKPISLPSYREKSRQVILDQSRSSNVAAIRLLEWHRELNLMRYHGMPEYLRRCWSNITWRPRFSFLSGFSPSSTAEAGAGTSSSSMPSVNSVDSDSSTGNKNVAKVAFMITSEQRRRLSVDLGYSQEDIRSFKPIEALLLLENGVKMEISGDEIYDFRAKLDELLKENERLINEEYEQGHQSSEGAGEFGKTKQIDREESVHRSVSPEAAQNMHLKPDVAMALLSAENDGTSCLPPTDAPHHLNPISDSHNGNENHTALDSTLSGESFPSVSPSSTTESPLAKTKPHPSSFTSNQTVNITSTDSETLAMKPDIAAVYLTAKQNQTQKNNDHFVDHGDNEHSDNEDDESSWYEIVEKISDSDDGGRVVALFPTKKEALEYVRIKESIGVKRDGGSLRGIFCVRRRRSV